MAYLTTFLHLLLNTKQIKFFIHKYNKSQLWAFWRRTLRTIFSFDVTYFFFPAKWTGLAEKKLNRLGVALDCFYKLQAILKNHPQVLYQIASMYPFLINNQMKCDKCSIFYATNCMLYAHFLIGFMLYYWGDNDSHNNMLIHLYIPFRERKFPC